MHFDVTGEGLIGSRLYPPDNELKRITIRPLATDPRFADAVVRLVSVRSTSGGDGTQPEFEILDAASDPASPEIVLLLRAALNRFGLPRFYYLTFEATTPSGLTGVGRVIIDTSVFFPRIGGFFVH